MSHPIAPARTDRDDAVDATPDRAAAVSALRELFAAGKKADSERRPYVEQCLDAARRLAAFAWSQRHETEQAETIVRALASIYNGRVARPVRLDEIRWLEWEHQRDLVAVMFGTGQVGTEDTHIRAAFHLAGGDRAVDWLHAHLDYTPAE